MSEWDKLWKEPRATYARWTSKEGDWIRRVKAEGDDLSHTVKALRSWLNDYCKVCLKLVTDCEDCNYGGFKNILEAEDP